MEVPLRYRLALLLMAMGAIAFLDRTNLSVAGVEVMREFRISNVWLGMTMSCFLLAYALSQVPAGFIVRRFGPRAVLAAGLVWWAVFSAATALIPPSAAGAVVLLAAVRFGLGMGEAVMYPAASAFIQRWFPAVERGRANGIVFGGVGLGSAATPPLITWMMLHYGWRSAFWFSGAVGVAVAAMWWAAARDLPEKHPAMDREELTHILTLRGKDELRSHGNASSLWGNRNLQALTVSYFAFGYVAWVFFGWFYIYLVQAREFSLKGSGLYSVLPFVAMTAGSIGGGIWSDRVTRKKGPKAGRATFSAVCFVLAAGTIALGVRLERPEEAAIALALGAGILYLAQGNFWAAVPDVVDANVPVASGVMNMGAQIGGACTATLTPLIAKRYGWDASFLSATGVALLGAAAWMVVRFPRKEMESRR